VAAGSHNGDLGGEGRRGEERLRVTQKTSLGKRGEEV